jgi:hypothetical protein
MYQLHGYKEKNCLLGTLVIISFFSLFFNVLIFIFFVEFLNTLDKEVSHLNLNQVNHISGQLEYLIKEIDSYNLEELVVILSNCISEKCLNL